MNSAGILGVNLSILQHTCIKARKPSFTEAFGSYWAGWWDETEEGIFSNANTGELLLSDMYQPWYLGEPNGDTLENCASVWSAKGAWNDLSCDATACGYCEFERAPDLQMRG